MELDRTLLKGEIKEGYMGAVCTLCHTPLGNKPFCPNDGTLREPGVLVGDRYQLQRLLGSGGMGFVYAARHKLLGKEVAVKMLRADLVSEADQVARFLREAQLCSQLRHENIVDITDFGKDQGGNLFLVMEMLVGTTLAQVLEREGKLPLRRAISVLRQLCRALDCAHGVGVVHRDLGPRNIFLTELSGRKDLVKLLDFGISRMAGGQDRLTSTGVAMGTTPYMPPEQLRGEKEQSRAVDMYALGVIAYELLTGKLPFEGETPAQMIAEKLTGEPMNLEKTDLGTAAPAIAQLVKECLEKDPQRRPASAAEVEQRLFSSGGLSSEQTEDLAGSRAGSYKLVKLLGSGGLGSVWLGEHPVIGSKVAVKILHPQMCESEEPVRRFVIEAQAVNRIDSPHIVKTFDFGKLSDGRDYSVMELLEGDTLAERLAKIGPHSWEQAQPIIVQIAQALVAAHEAEIVHRDLKPENVHLGSDGEHPTVKVLDFGIAKLLSGDVAATHKTQLGVGIGTPLYASPEQVAGDKIGPATDIYAFGVVCFEMLVGRPPFTGTIQEVLAAKITKKPPALGDLVSGLHSAIGNLVDRMLLSAPEKRPTAHDILAVILKLATEKDGVKKIAEEKSTASRWKPVIKSVAPSS
ncbi:MAG: serine/threonine-protein kinase, partial [Pseudomonadota bacterium]